MNLFCRKSTALGIILLSLNVVSVESSASDTDISRIGITNDPEKLQQRSKLVSMDEKDAEAHLAAKLEETKAEIRLQLCDIAPTNVLCSNIPNDNTDFSELFVYMFIIAAAQNPFDIFSWQTFVGLNWPADLSGNPLESKIGTASDAPRVWLDYETPREIFEPEYVDQICGNVDTGDKPVLYTSNFKQTGSLPLIDTNLNYVLYDVRVNSAMAEYVRSNNLDTIPGQTAFRESGQEIDFPLGYFDDPVSKTGGAPGSTAIKTAWKIMDRSAGDDPSKYYTIQGYIPIEAENSESGVAMCLQAQLGLVGMHIMRRTKSGNGPDWTWSTFEHVDNAPFAENSRKPVDTLHEVLFEGGCKAPIEVDTTYAFFDPDCENCKTNHIEGADWKWSDTAPFAKNYGVNGTFGAQVVRCWEVFEGTRVVNEIWQEALKGTVWANYESSSAQWKGANKGMMFPQGEVPRFLTNSTLETYDQFSSLSSCLGCHANAKSVAGSESNFSFLLGLAAKYQKQKVQEKLSFQ